MNSLDKSVVEIWSISLKEDGSKFRDWLSTEELLKVKKLGDRYLLTRGYLRQILAGYLNIQPKKISFNYGLYGKPELINSSIKFNLSHSGNLVVYAITFNQEIGVDIEYIKHRAYDRLVKRFFSPTEQISFNNLSPEKQHLGFFRGWTTKEGYLKACGTGIRESLANIEVSLNPDRLPEIYQPNGWYCQNIILPDNYTGVVVTSQPIDRLIYRT